MPVEQFLETIAATFSILGRIGGDATTAPQGSSPTSFQTFSILGRIGGDATTLRRIPPLLRDAAFSILGRIGGDATFGHTHQSRW